MHFLPESCPRAVINSAFIAATDVRTKLTKCWTDKTTGVSQSYGLQLWKPRLISLSLSLLMSRHNEFLLWVQNLWHSYRLWHLRWYSHGREVWILKHIGDVVQERPVAIGSVQFRVGKYAVVGATGVWEIEDREREGRVSGMVFIWKCQKARLPFQVKDKAADMALIKYKSGEAAELVLPVFHALSQVAQGSDFPKEWNRYKKIQASIGMK